MKVAIVHPYQQHSYKLAEAMEISNREYSYFTSIYNKKGTLTRFITRFLKSEDKVRAKSRISKTIDEKNVIVKCEIHNLILLLMDRIIPNTFIHSWWKKFFELRFNLKVSKYIAKHNFNILISFDTHSFHLYKYLNSKNIDIVKILDMSAPNLNHMNKIFNNYLDSNLELLSVEKPSRCINSPKIDYELRTANYFLAASNFTRASLLSEGINESLLFNIPYGIESVTDKKEQKDEKVKFGFVGRLTYEKGIYDLLKTIDSITIKNVEFLFFGKYDKKDKFINKYRKNVVYYGHIPKKAMLEHYNNIDYLIFPTLADGFGFAVLEAMSKGVPVICSDNTGASDIVNNGKNGYVYKTGDTKELLKLVEYCAMNITNYNQMSADAIETAKNYTWDKYFKQIDNLIEYIGGKK